METLPQFARLLLLVDHAVPFKNTSLEIPQMLHCGEKYIGLLKSIEEEGKTNPLFTLHIFKEFT